MKADKRISVFEYDILRRGEHNGVVFSKEHLEALSRYSNEKRVPWFELVYNGIRFTSFVGALQVKDLLIEVLPKIDKAKVDVDLWHHVLVSMLRDVGMLQVIETGTSTLRLKSNSLLELYFGRFVTECEKLVHKGLVRRYRKHQGNLNALKGAIHFGRHITENLVHQERFYTRHNVYDYNHVFNSLLFQALIVIRRLTNTPQLHSRIQCLLLCFPETDIFNPTERLFGTLPFSRSTEPYRPAIEIARLILLNYHPDILKGNNHVLALMFDMNKLWERWIGRQFARHLPDWKVEYNQSKDFWNPETGRVALLRPDFQLTSPEGERWIVDTKWKTPSRDNPDDHDLRQVFAYTLMFQSHRGILLYPGHETLIRKGTYCYHQNETPLNCHTLYLNIIDSDSGLLKGNEVKRVMGC